MNEIKYLLKQCGSEEEKIKTLLSNRMSKDINQEHEEKLTFKDKITDKVAAFSGSWKFIISYLLFIFTWIFLNSFVLVHLSITPFDPYSYTLLNLVLGVCLSVQSALIGLSQNRANAKQKIRDNNEYNVNLKAEVLIEEIYNKIENLEKQINDMNSKE